MNVLYFLTNKTGISVSLLIVAFAMIQLTLVWDGGLNQVFNSPDANANYHFATRIYEGLNIGIDLDINNPESAAYLATRSSKVIGKTIVPTSFFGLMLIFGLLSKILTVNVIVYLTIFFSSLGLYFFYKLNSILFTQSIGLLSLLLLITHPAWFYYTNASLFPNILFLSLLITSSYFFVKVKSKGNLITYMLAATFLSLSFIVRPVEFVWITPALIVYLGAIHKRLSWRYALIAAIPFTIIVGATWWMQSTLSSSAFGFGYTLPAIENAQGVHVLKSVLFPFGFDPRLIIRNFWNYGVIFFYPFTLLLLLSAVYIFRFGKNNKTILYYSGLFLLLSSILFVFYGSWRIVDAPDAQIISIGTSYVRYFLPIYVFSIPIIAYVWLQTTSKLPYRVHIIITVAVLIVLSIFNYRTAVTGSNESIFAQEETLYAYDAISSWIRENTPDESIIVTYKGDKYIWPHRAVITAPDSIKTRKVLRQLIIEEQRALYYLVVTIDESYLHSLNDEWGSSGLLIDTSIYTYADVSIYPINAL